MPHFAWLLLAGLLAVGCSGLAALSHGDAGTILGADAGPLETDGGAVPDDAGALEDAGVRLDGGATGDAGAFVDGGAAACPASALFCESFESGIDPTRWAVNGEAASFSVDTSLARDGHGALHLAYGAPYGHTGTQSLQLKTAIRTPDDRLFLRVYVRFGDLKLPGAHPAFVDVIDRAFSEVAFGSNINELALLGWVPGELDASLLWIEGDGVWHPSNQDGDSTPDTEHAGTPRELRAQRWICLEMMFFGDHQGEGDTAHPAEEVKVWLDGAEIPELGGSDALWREALGKAPPEHWSPVYDDATWRFGVESFGPTNVALDLWFDALVFSHTRVGCLP